MAKIATLGDNKTYIAPALGPPIWGKYSKGQGYCVRGYLSFQVPRVPGTGVIKFPGLFDLGAGHLQFEINNPRQNSGPYPGALEGARKLLPLELGTHTFRILAPDRESQGFGNIGVIVP